MNEPLHSLVKLLERLEMFLETFAEQNLALVLRKHFKSTLQTKAHRCPYFHFQSAICSSKSAALLWYCCSEADDNLEIFMLPIVSK